MQILQLLSDGNIHSGERLGEVLGISRAAVWKQIDALRKKGLEVEVIPGKGYRLPRTVEAWNRERLLESIAPTYRGLLADVVIEEVTTSTNDVVAARLRDDPAGAVVCLAEEQTAGRGRRGREWFSPWGRSFYGSLGWIFPEGIAALEGLSLAIGVAVVRALKRQGVEGAQLKWPNDLVVGEAKLGGILIEVQAEAGGPCQAIIGLGLNLELPPDSSERLGRPVADVKALVGRTIERNRLGGIIIEEILRLLQDYSRQRFESVRAEWQALDSLQGQRVEVSGLAQPVEGIARGVDEHGALLVETPEGIQRVQAGEVSLRKQP
ncbi:MAG TPA: biotin--[acetyl-CoA-carboxylase] ligase [Moraxellaceae bacterium]|nr:biotin--[acetyl-CoA-carboxylase] ligase [Moraxellaceae bacterium]